MSSNPLCDIEKSGAFFRLCYAGMKGTFLCQRRAEEMEEERIRKTRGGEKTLRKGGTPPLSLVVFYSLPAALRGEERKA